jgi:hypothetical protein
MIERDSYLAQRERFRADGKITTELYELFARIVTVVVFGTRLPPAYSPTGHWDRDSVQEALHGWIERRLLRTNALLAAFDLAAEPGPFIASLERNFRHYLENEKERSELDNLVSRASQLLREDEAFDDFVKSTRASDVWWGLAGWYEAAPYQGSDDHLVSLAFALGEVVLFRYSAKVGRASPVLSTETLRDFLIRLFEATEGLLTIRHLAIVFSRRFHLGPPQQVELGREEAEVADPAAEVDDEAARAAAASLLAELSERQLQAILARAEDLTLEQIATRLGVSRGTADNALRSMAPLIEKHCADGVGKEQILEKLLDALS